MNVLTGQPNPIKEAIDKLDDGSGYEVSCCSSHCRFWGFINTKSDYHAIVPEQATAFVNGLPISIPKGLSLKALMYWMVSSHPNDNFMDISGVPNACISTEL